MIEVINLTTNLIDKAFLKKVGQRVLKGEKQTKKSLSIILIRQDRIKKLNKKYRGENKATDVLSFDYIETGELLICLQKIKENAKIYQTSFKKELTRILIHGILHLLGYDHEKSAIKAEKMRKKEEYYYGKN